VRRLIEEDDMAFQVHFATALDARPEVGRLSIDITCSGIPGSREYRFPPRGQSSSIELETDPEIIELVLEFWDDFDKVPMTGRFSLSGLRNGDMLSLFMLPESCLLGVVVHRNFQAGGCEIRFPDGRTSNTCLEGLAGWMILKLCC
jgi:hypothetical protein